MLKLMSARLPVFAALIGIGLIACVIFVIGANRFCPAETAQSTLRVNTGHYLDHNKGNHAGDGNASSNQDHHDAVKTAAAIDSSFTTSDKTDSKNEAGDHRTDAYKWISKFFCEAKIGDIAIAFFTYCLVIVGGLQARRLRQTITTMEQTERPYMLLSDLTIRGIHTPPDEAGIVKVLLEYKTTNYGRSPAFLRRTFLAAAVAKELSEPPRYDDTNAIRFIVAVNGWYGSIAPSEVGIDGNRIRELLAGNSEFFVWGMLEYSGIAPSPHKTRFAYRMIFDDNGNSKQFYPDGPDSYWENT
jgi:hypothetical protein